MVWFIDSDGQHVTCKRMLHPCADSEVHLDSANGKSVPQDFVCGCVCCPDFACLRLTCLLHQVCDVTGCDAIDSFG
jgi:hypothetical protein